MHSHCSVKPFSYKLNKKVKISNLPIAFITDSRLTLTHLAICTYLATAKTIINNVNNILDLKKHWRTKKLCMPLETAIWWSNNTLIILIPLQVLLLIGLNQVDLLRMALYIPAIQIGCFRRFTNSHDIFRNKLIFI